MSSHQSSAAELATPGNKRPMTDEASLSPAKRAKGSPQKRVSSGSTSSESSSRKLGKTVSGQLVTKNMYCVNNEAFYLFKFLVDNVSKNYYGNASHFQNLQVDTTYDIDLAYENKRIVIAKATESKAVEKTLVVKRFVEQSDFDGEDTVSIVVKFSHGFKVLDADAYKAVFVVNFGDSYETCYQVQLECMANLSRWSACIKDDTITNEHELLEYFYNAQNKMFNFCRIKCQQSNGNYKNFSLQNITQLSLASKPVCVVSEESENISSISRSNKRVLQGTVAKINVERQSADRFSIAYTLVDGGDEWVRGSFFVKQNDKKSEKLDKLETDLNQLNDLIENDIVKVYIYVAVDLTSRNYNVLGLTKVETETSIFEGV
ncbi:lef3 [Peridroma alphabaculovirus]|uniref:Lef3 n=1 Tax=Peridroma alphabaculovirus TaxID=1346829 RepID=A0A068LRH5_9ABAC|nr:lef3 [Peridroma alphabaculovirus]AIE47790.1 lef3 [Peridroma alphabaculovirus]